MSKESGRFKLFYIAIVIASIAILFFENYKLQKELDSFKTSVRFQTEYREAQMIGVLENFMNQAPAEMKKIARDIFQEELESSVFGDKITVITSGE